MKLGLDPTAPAVTLGWAVVLRKLRQFQDAGHVAVLIVGDFTGRVGDPSGKSETRPRLSKEEVDGYAERLLDQFWMVLDRDRTEVRYNSEWLEPLDMEAILRLTATTTVARMLERDDFAKRYAEGKPISSWSSCTRCSRGWTRWRSHADVELGGTDQLFNLLVGRDVQREHDQEPQVALTTPLLVGTDGEQKMSQSLGNYIGIAEPPDEMFGKLADHRRADPQYRLLTLDFFRDPAEADRARGAGRRNARPVGREAADGSRRRGPLPRTRARERRRETRFDRVHHDRELPESVHEQSRSLSRLCATGPSTSRS